MKNTIALTVLCLALTACGTRVASSDPLDNPLYVERYGEALVNTVTELEIYKDPSLEDSNIQAAVDSSRQYWLDQARKASRLQREGYTGHWQPMKEYAQGEVLYLPDALYFGPGFEAEPGPELRVYLTTVVDARQVDFPDETALDLGPLTLAFGTQAYAVPEVDEPIKYRTVALWDTKLKRLYGMAQLSPNN